MDLLSDGSAPQFQLDPIQRGQDAKILFNGSLGGGFLVTSGSNTLSGVIEGVTIDLLAASDEQTTLTIERDDSSLSEGLQALVDAYNSLRDKADQYDTYDSESLQKGTLYGNANLRSFVSELTRIVTQMWTDCPVRTGRSKILGCLSMERVGFLRSRGVHRSTGSGP